MNERPRLAGARAVVTGAGSGLGRAIALELARRGCKVVVADIRPDAAEATLELLRAQAGGRHLAFPCDVRDPQAVEAMAELADRELGGTDVIVNNAGVAVAGRVDEVSLDDWRFAVDVNLWGVVNGCRSFVPRLRRQGGGFVLNVASAAGLLSPPELGPYNVTKAAVVALSETLAGELAGSGVSVTVLCPTFFVTGILDASRGGDPAARDFARQLMERSRVQAPDVARAALDALERGRLYALPMRDGRIMWRLKRALPGRFPALVARVRARIAPR